ncbi:hypothetical protein L1987_86952 [Smallanthus sonchifolius]|uniref:Uncharacterized protein n=1 Tax=Smallanthus sonchifolius TaxID=185202 RepID=A0ACB8Y046_9ASTR|nr:hypothetical protein L1987_86952 [Smallanthus sonchifolius]
MKDYCQPRRRKPPPPPSSSSAASLRFFTIFLNVKPSSISFDKETIIPNGMPATRAVVLRRFQDTTNRIQINEDIRTHKLTNVQDAVPGSEPMPPLSDQLGKIEIQLSFKQTSVKFLATQVVN